MPQWFIPLMSIGVFFNTVQGFSIARRQRMAGFRFASHCVLATTFFVWFIFAAFWYLSKHYKP